MIDSDYERSEEIHRRTYTDLESYEMTGSELMPDDLHCDPALLRDQISIASTGHLEWLLPELERVDEFEKCAVVLDVLKSRVQEGL